MTLAPNRRGMLVDPSGRIGYPPLPPATPPARTADLCAALLVVLLDDDGEPNPVVVLIGRMYSRRFAVPAPLLLDDPVGRALFCRRRGGHLDPVAASTAARLRRLVATVCDSNHAENL
ncbi:hypothetical protein [Rhodococcus sp. NPDC058514]|uniref:hypothetical protein n=1 Tax=unclassified Rhodococcus (in: high G+C Gram-positive bacteria) TaxID=192944 RepID=UPI003664856E